LKNIWDRLERLLMRLVVIGIVAIVLVQGIMTHDSWRLYLSWGERMEGQSIEYPAINMPERELPRKHGSTAHYSRQADLVLEAKEYSSLPRAVLLVNGQKTASFEETKKTLKVRGGDVVEIDSTAYNFPIEYVVREVSPNCTSPKKGQLFTANQNIVMVGKIIVK
jgi:hypothetical protein